MGVIRRIEIVMPVHEYLREIVLAEKARKKKRLRCLQARPVESLLPSPTTWISVEDLLRKEGQDGGTLALRLEDDKADERPFCLSSFRVLSVLSSANRPLLLQCRDADGEEKALIFKTDDNMDNDRLCQDIARWLDAETIVRGAKGQGPNRWCAPITSPPEPFGTAAETRCGVRKSEHPT